MSANRSEALHHEDVRIEMACEEDLPEVLAILEKNDLPEANLSEHVASLLVARHDGEMVGCAALGPIPTSRALPSRASADNRYSSPNPRSS